MLKAKKIICTCKNFRRQNADFSRISFNQISFHISHSRMLFSGQLLKFTVTKFVRQYFPNVFAVQVEMNGYYRCLSDSNPQDVGRMMNALGQYVNYANDNL